MNNGLYDYLDSKGFNADVSEGILNSLGSVFGSKKKKKPIKRPTRVGTSADLDKARREATIKKNNPKAHLAKLKAEQGSGRVGEAPKPRPKPVAPKSSLPKPTVVKQSGLARAGKWASNNKGKVALGAAGATALAMGARKLAQRRKERLAASSDVSYDLTEAAQKVLALRGARYRNLNA